VAQVSFADVIEELGQGSYTVTRMTAAARTLGRRVAGSTSTLTITASVQPLTGRDLKTKPEGQHADDCRTVYTTTALLTRDTTHEADLIAIGGEAFEVYRVKQWDAFGETFYVAQVSRNPIP
jgi:hypothetical protein